MFSKIEQLCKICNLEISQKDKNKIIEKVYAKQLEPCILKKHVLQQGSK